MSLPRVIFALLAGFALVFAPVSPQAAPSQAGVPDCSACPCPTCSCCVDRPVSPAPQPVPAIPPSVAPLDGKLAPCAAAHVFHAGADFVPFVFPPPSPLRGWQALPLYQRNCAYLI